ncbi:adenylate cyclase type 10-like [Venturia canescens]|uniref:adenylate cyclase type 10-like n=1 Tax=Venturia canescens TaxID=32260 RepID=UPI001C9C5209|nr:adenylate cyclase type 10-like [Venturia canescens]
MSRRSKLERIGPNSLNILKDIDEDKYDSYINIDEKQRNSLRDEEHTKIFASMCPDEILDYYDDYSSRTYHTTLMLGDVSGFTELAEKYTNSGRGGPSKLTETLNSYIGAMVQEILSHNGDVLKFSGDAFIVMWKVQDDTIMRDVAIEAIHTACIIQKHFGTYSTDVGVTLKVKLAIASGKISFTSIGDPEKTSYYIITGKPVWDVKSAEALCRGGDILVAPSCWRWANPNEFVHETLPDGMHTLVTESALMWQHPPKEKYDLEAEYSAIQKSTNLFPNYSSVLPRKTGRPDNKKTSDSKTSMQLTGNSNVHDFEIKQVDYSLRPKVTKAAKHRLKSQLQSYMLPPVVRSVEHDEPIEYLTEMRQVVIVFVNVVTSRVSKTKLILIVDAAYKLVCGIVGEMQGCVNKTSLFDKDLMFLCIFGLRGDKHELESQIGLRCATKIRESLSSMRNIVSVTVGVTTGITYCGVVGHILRREYTVIGMTVNKAARLMCAYNNKVICDRDSFLHSRLPARHFVLQEPKHLKGITNVGPVYEFLEQTHLELNQHPVLGREKELKMFIELLSKIIEFWEAKKIGIPTPKNTLIIRGEPRMGKSRLLDAINHTIPTEIARNHITLVSSDYQVPYTLVHLIFTLPMGIGSSISSSKDREDKIIQFLGKIRYPHYLCALNQAFNVNFATSARYQSLGENEKLKLLRKLVAKLTHTCFDRLWVIIVDDAENIDPESFSLLATIVKQDRAFFVLSFGKKMDTESRFDPFIIERAKIIELVGIDKWFHAALACQFLNVIAIPPELEKVIQERSMGNPGWIESYLVSLKQAGGIVLKKIRMKNLRGMGYVIPSKMLLDRSASTKDKNILESEPFTEKYDGWKMFQTSFIESSSNERSEGETRDSVLAKMEDEKPVTICSIRQNFVLEDVDTELTMDVIILKLFDSLTPLDQFLLKCASVLGETVNRDMLEKLMEGTTNREIGYAVTKLFEIRILGCAAGDFRRSPGPLMFFRHVRKRNIDIEIRCGCTGLPIRESLVDLPKYASCGLMRFKMSLFRDTTYRLLTDNQKVDLHTKALKYLRQNTRRCEACGGGQFARLLGRIYPESIKIEKRRIENLNHVSNLSDYARFHLKLKIFLFQFFSFARIVLKKWFVESSTRSTVTNVEIPSCISFGQPLSKRPTRTFSNFDFTNCQCTVILNTVYSQMLDHYRRIQRKDKTLTAILEYVEILLIASNVPQARKLLNEAQQILVEIFSPGRDDELITLPYLFGKIKTLQGQCNLESGLINEAHRLLDQAIKSLGWNFPKTSIMARCKSRVLLEEQRLILTCLRDWKVGVAQGDAANYNEQLSNCLAQMFIVFREFSTCSLHLFFHTTIQMKGFQDHAKLAAIWGLNAAVASSKDFLALCTAYANMITTAHYFQHRSIIPILEIDAMNICTRRRDDLDLQELRAIAKLYSSIFFSRWLRGQTVRASSLGFVALKIARNVRSVSLRINILPKLIHLLMVECRHDEVVTLLRELEFISNNDMDKSGRTWYYALCVDFQLEAGITVLPYKKCEQYYQEEGETMINLRDPEAETSYFTSMWLWCVRMEEWEAASIWKSKQMKITNKINEHTIAGSITILRRLEGLLIYYVHKMGKRNAKALETILIDIQKLFKIVEKLLAVVEVIRARYVLMKSYYNMVKFRTKMAMKLLKRSKKIAVKMDNKLIYEWADHCEKAWTGSLSVLQRDFWKERCDKVSRISWQIVDQKPRKTIPYTLPLPIYPQNL